MGTVESARKKSIKILLIDNDSIVRAGVRLLIKNWARVDLIGVTSNLPDALAIVAREKPDIILLEIELGQTDFGFDLLASLRSVRADGRVIVLTGLRDVESHYRAMQLGAVGLVLKSQPPEDLRNAILKVHAGEAWLDPKLMMSIVTSMSLARGRHRNEKEKEKIDLLTKREREVAALIGEGIKNKTIAERLFISETTVRHHLTSIFSKLEVSDRFELLIYLYRHKLIRSEDVHAAGKAANS
jgi:DNA-binding NarL/FixJ family response regulator